MSLRNSTLAANAIRRISLTELFALNTAASRALLNRGLGDGETRIDLASEHENGTWRRSHALRARSHRLMLFSRRHSGAASRSGSSQKIARSLAILIDVSSYCVLLSRATSRGEADQPHSSRRSRKRSLRASTEHSYRAKVNRHDAAKIRKAAIQAQGNFISRIKISHQRG
jgi:hypothetical protein